MSRKTIGGLAAVAVIYYTIYGMLAAFIEPFTWFGSAMPKHLGSVGHVLLLIMPLFGASVVYGWYHLRRKQIETMLGVAEVSSGKQRVDAFQALRSRARQHIIVVGIGMTSIVSYDLRSIAEQARDLPLDFLMIDPEFLEEDAEFSTHLQHFLDIPDFTAKVRSAFDRLKTFCDEWNEEDDHRHKLSLKVYHTIPTNSMVIIDPDDDTGEAIVEFFLYRSGAYRPRFLVKKINDKDSLFNRIVTEYRNLWSSARRVV